MDGRSRQDEERRLYPIFTDLRDRPCVVVGRTRLADEKAESLKRAGALLKRMSTFQPDEAREAFLIIADVDAEQGRTILEFGDRHRIFVNVVDKPPFCTFNVPAILERGDLLLAISSNGKSPALSGWLKKQLAEVVEDTFEVVLRALGNTREQVKERLPSYQLRKDFYYELFDSNFLGESRSQRLPQIEDRILRRSEEFSHE